jgi:branched-chain amino acid aminotransferase
MCLRRLAEEMGMKVEQRPVLVEELAEFDEVGACGTAAVISPIKRIVDRESGKEYKYCCNGSAGPISTKLYQTLKGIQEGEIEDIYGWNLIID